MWPSTAPSLVCPHSGRQSRSLCLSLLPRHIRNDAFRFYLLEVSNRVANFLGDLQQSANETRIDLDVVEWDLKENLKDWTVLWDYGALLALTDCVYKSMKDHGLAYIVDLDEFIVPQVTGLGHNFSRCNSNPNINHAVR